MKTYSTKSNANRAAAKAYNGTGRGYTLTGSKEEGFSIKVECFTKDDLAAAEAAGHGVIDFTDADKELVESIGRTDCPHCGEHLSNGYLHADDDCDGKPRRAHDDATHEWQCMACNGQFGEKLEADPILALFRAHGYDQPRNLCRALRSIARDWRTTGGQRKTFLNAAKELGLKESNASAEWQSSFTRLD